MSTTYTPDNTNNPTSYQSPEDGELADVASILAFLEGLADKCAHVLEGDPTFLGDVTIGATGTLTIADGSSMEVVGTSNFVGDVEVSADTVNMTDAALEITFPVGTAPTITFAGDAPQILFDDNVHTRGIGGYGVKVGDGTIKWPIGNTLAFGDVWAWPLLEVPHGAALRKIGVRINPADNTLPTTKVRIQIYATHVGSPGGSTLLASLEDPLTGAAYQAEHDFVFDVTGSDINIDLVNETYWVWILGETGGDEDNVSIVGAPWVEYSAGSLDLGR